MRPDVRPGGGEGRSGRCTAAGECAAGGRIAAVLEDGYDLAAIGEGVGATLAATRGARPAAGDRRRAARVLAPVRAVQAPYRRL